MTDDAHPSVAERRVECPECGTLILDALLDNHKQHVHNIDPEA